jgi:hypothetical protein
VPLHEVARGLDDLLVCVLGGEGMLQEYIWAGSADRVTSDRLLGPRRTNPRGCNGPAPC